LIARTEELEDALAARMADDGSRIPHEVALAIMDGERPVVAYRRHRGLTLRDLAARTGLAVGYLSEIERGLQPGSTSALSRNRRRSRDHHRHAGATGLKRLDPSAPKDVHQRA
jgi:hypothetical protein